MTAPLHNVAFNICQKGETHTFSSFSSERRGGWKASAPLSAAAAAARLGFAPSVYIKCHSHSHAPSITPNSQRLRPPTPLFPAGQTRESLTSPRSPSLAACFPKPQDFPPSKGSALHNRKSLYNQQHITAIKSFSLRRVLLWQPSPLRMPGD